MKIAPSFPKIIAVGAFGTEHLFTGPVEVTEKVDGSQFCFGLNEAGEVVMRSKGKEQTFDVHDVLFARAVEFVRSKEDIIKTFPPDTYLYGEYLNSLHHNVLTYERMPTNHILVFGVMKGAWFVTDFAEIAEWAAEVELETVPLLHRGDVKTMDDLMDLLTRTSVLGKETVEGIVVKNYAQTTLFNGQLIPVFGKYVREQFKERHKEEWKPRRDKLAEFIETFVTEARWQKAVQHLRDRGELETHPRDIAKLIKEVEVDLLEEEAQTIKDGLYAIYKDDFVRRARTGLPEWYKAKLAANAFRAGDAEAAAA